MGKNILNEFQNFTGTLIFQQRLDCHQRWKAKCNHVRTGGMLTTHSPMSASNTTSIVYTTSATTSPTTTGTAGPTNKGNQNNLVLTTCD